MTMMSWPEIDEHKAVSALHERTDALKSPDRVKYAKLLVEACKLEAALEYRQGTHAISLDALITYLCMKVRQSSAH